MPSFSPTLSLYLGKRFFVSIFLTSLIISAFIFLMDFVELTRRLSTKPDITGDTAILLVLLKIPDLMLQVSPFAILIGTMVCFSRLSKGHELIAIRAAGMPARQFLIPPLLVCLMIGVFNLTTLNPMASTMLKSHQRTMAEIFPGSASGLLTEGGHIWLKQQDPGKELIIYAKSVQEQGELLKDATVFIMSDKGEFLERIDAVEMKLNVEHWELVNPLVIRPNETSQRQPSYLLATSLTPEMIRKSFTSPRTLSVWELKKFIALLEESGFPTEGHRMHWQRTLASPALALAMFLIAAPFALHFSRQRSVASMILLGLGFGFGFYLFTNFISAYGMAGRINIALAAWMPTAIAGLLGLALFLHFREE